MTIQFERINQPATVAKGMRVFTLLWLGLITSQVGSGLTSFALDVWVYQHTGSVTQFALLTICIALPRVLISPIAGTLVDRWSRRWTMLISNIFSGLCILCVGLLYMGSRLEIWHIYLATAGFSTFMGFHLPAFKASITLMVPKEQLSRASGMTEMGNAITHLISPALGGVLLGLIQLKGVIALDLSTLLFALIPLIVFRLPEVDSKEVRNDEEKQPLINDTVEGWTYLARRPGLVGLIVLKASYILMLECIVVLFTPLMITLTTPTRFGVISSIAGLGMFAGSLFLGIWDNRQQHFIDTIVVCSLLSGFAMICGGASSSLLLFTISIFCIALTVPLVNGLSQVLFQRKVTPEIQGRVFAVNNMFMGVAPPFAAVAIGPMVDYIFEPRLNFNGDWADSIIGQIIGSGPGRGIGFTFILIGILMIIITVTAYQYTPLRLLESELPDADDVV
ncbi:MAG: MFS transporter [Hormoscilla sp.]